MTSATKRSQFQSLKALINSSLAAYEKELDQAGVPEPNLIDVHPLDNTFEQLASAQLVDAQNTLIGALEAMTAIVTPPATQLHFRHVLSHHVAECLNVFLHAKIPDYLEEAGPSGISTKELSSKTKIEEGKLRRIMRYLTTRFLVCESSPDVFIASRISKSLVQGGPARGFVFWIGSSIVPSAASFQESILDPAYSHSYDQADCAMALQFDFRGNGWKYVFDWVQNYKGGSVEEFADAMGSLSRSFNLALLADFPWADLEGKTVVDIGGGNGSFLLSILAAHPQLKGVVQDRRETIEFARKNFTDNMPEGVRDGRVEFDSIDFFKSQPRSGKEYTYMMRFIIHDYPDHIALNILKNISDQMNEHSRLIIVDTVIPPTDDLAATEELYPLTGATSSVRRYAFELDMIMLESINSQERTVAEFKNLFAQSGLELVRTYNTRCMLSLLEVKKKA